VFKINKKIDNPVDCKVRSLIRFLNAQNVCAIDIHRQLTAVYGEGVMNESTVRKWCRMFNEGRTNVHDEERCRHPSLITEDLKKQTDEQIRQDRRRLLTNCMRHSLKFLDPFFMKFSASISVTKQIVQGRCHGCWQTTTGKKRMGAALTFFGALSPRRRQVSRPYCHRG
jgi:hypothetical protein